MSIGSVSREPPHIAHFADTAHSGHPNGLAVRTDWSVFADISSSGDFRIGIFRASGTEVPTNREDSGEGDAPQEGSREVAVE
jgi:hypothetical protein